VNRVNVHREVSMLAKCSVDRAVTERHRLDDRRNRVRLTVQLVAQPTAHVTTCDAIRRLVDQQQVVVRPANA
jgi:hypothetical protein